VTYISRLQCVQAAVHRQVEALALLYPHHRLGLITFNHELALYGDGTISPISYHTRHDTTRPTTHDTMLNCFATGPGDSLTVAGDHLEEMDQLVAKGKEFGKAKCALPAKEARSALVKKVPRCIATLLLKFSLFVGWLVGHSFILRLC
jgi:hypothetical protein